MSILRKPIESPFDSRGNEIDLSVVVPCFNEEQVLPEFEQRLSAVCEASVATSYEIVLVNDGSTDKSGKIVAEMSARNPNIIGIELSRNFGHQIALTAGLSFARGNRVLVIDADLQDPPELLPEMLRIMDQGANIVNGKREERAGDSNFKRHSAKWFYKLIGWFADFYIPPDTGDFRLMDRKSLDVLLSMPEQFRFIRGMVAWIGLNQVELPYKRQPRFAGKTKYPINKMISFAIDAVTGFSLAPLRFVTFLAVLASALAGVIAAYALISWFLGATVRGWTSLLLLFLLFTSAQLTCIAIIGEYVGRTYIQGKQRPLFIVKEVYAHNKKSADSLRRG